MVGSRCRVIETDEQVGRQTHHLKEDENLENVGGYHQTQHREREQRQEGVVTLESLLGVTVVVAHVPEAVEVHHQRYRGDDHEHHCGDGVNQDAHAHHQCIGKRQPGGIGNDNGLSHTVHHLALAAAEEIGQRHAIGKNGIDQHGQHANHTGDFSTHFYPDESQEQEHEQGQCYNYYC